MNVFHRFTRESLIRNRSRTLVTIVGIILSVALLTAVTEGAYSGVQFLRRSVEQRVGSFFGYIDNLTAKSFQRVMMPTSIRTANM